MGKQSEKMAAALESTMPQEAENPVNDESAAQDIEQARMTDVEGFKLGRHVFVGLLTKRG